MWEVKALACLDLQSVDDLRAAEGSAGSGPEIQRLGVWHTSRTSLSQAFVSEGSVEGTREQVLQRLMDPAVMKMMTCHSRYLLQMAMAIGDRKERVLQPVIQILDTEFMMNRVLCWLVTQPGNSVESCRLMGDLPDADPVPAEAPVAAEGPEEEEEEEEEGTLAGPCAFDGGPGLPEGELQCRPNTPARSIDSADLVLADPGPLWSSLHRSFAEGAGPATPLPARSCAQLLQMAREMYRQKLFDESQQLLLTEAARELLGDGLDHFGEAWMQQQLSVMRSKQVGSLDPRSKRELESPKFIRSLQALFDLTTRQVITRDRQGKLPTRLKVVKAKRSVNLDAYRAYYARRAEIEQALAQPAPGAETATRLDDCLTIGPTGCYLSRELRLMQGVWLDADTGSRWLIDGDQVYRVPVLAAQLLDPTKAAAIHDSEDVQQLRPVQQPVVVSVEVSGPAEMRPRVPQFAREIRKRAKDDEDCEENPQDKMPVKATYHGWLDESGMRVTWRCEKTATFFSWERETNFQGIWRIAGSYCLLMHVDAFREGAKHLDSRKSRLGKVSRSRRGEAWFDREVQKLCEEGRDCGEAQAPTFLMHLVGELFPIWTDMSPNIMTFRSTTFKGFVDYEGSEICAEPMSESERPRMSAFRPRRTLLGRRTTHVVQPFLSKTWGYRESATVDLSAKELNLKSNELWLFHGTRESAAESITENEFQLKMAGTNRGTMFGPGIYMADAVTKSDEYTEPDPTGLRTMILCRCTMGRAIKQFEGGRECMKAAEREVIFCGFRGWVWAA
ncbi:tank-1 [Symbiodinium sp. CCMP2592]|nr:tank-1 [Symbiodinium sp. CCMP2592]